MKAIASLILIFLTSHTAYGIGSFDSDKYKDECGGKVYSKCDSPKLNQLTIYKEAEKMAQSLNKKVLLIVGADWCPPCNTLNAALKSNPEALAEIEESFVIVEISGDTRVTKSSQDVNNYLSITPTAFPTVYSVESDSTKLSFEVPLSSFSNISIIKNNILSPVIPPSLEDDVKTINQIGGIPLEALDVPVDLNEKYGQYPYFKSKNNKETEADKYLNAGIARLNVFHYIDAARSFKGALKIEPNNALAKAFLAVAYINLGRGDDSKKLSNFLVSKLDTEVSSLKDRLWIQFAKAYVYRNAGNLEKDTSDVGSQKAIEELYKGLPNDTEVLTLATYLSVGTRNPKAFAQALLQKSDHAGAHHYLVHFYEGEMAYPLAADAAVELASIATDSAHAQHMLGHIAPRLEKWELAHDQFMKATKLHLEWADKYNFPVSYDWHYSHNMDLMGSVYVGLNEIEKGMELFLTSCDFDSRACISALRLGAYLGNTSGLDKIRNRYGDRVFSSSNLKSVSPFLVVETHLEDLMNKPNKLNEYFTELLKIPDSKITGAEILMKRVIYSYMNKTPLDINITDNVTLYAEDRLGCASFDGWGKGMLDLLRLIKFSKVLGFNEIEDEINAILDSELGIEFTYQSSMGVIAPRK